MKKEAFVNPFLCSILNPNDISFIYMFTLFPFWPSGWFQKKKKMYQVLVALDIYL